MHQCLLYLSKIRFQIIIRKQHKSTTTTPGPQSLIEVLQRLPKPALDEYQFRADVVQVQEDMLEKFPKHPDMILDKLAQLVEKERAK